jgi:hypothetical protein
MRPPIQAKGMMTKKTVRIPMVSVHPCSFHQALDIGRSVEIGGHTHSMATKPTTIPTTTPTSKIAQAITFRVLKNGTSGLGSIVTD